MFSNGLKIIGGQLGDSFAENKIGLSYSYLILFSLVKLFSYYDFQQKIDSFITYIFQDQEKENGMSHFTILHLKIWVVQEKTFMSWFVYKYNIF